MNWALPVFKALLPDDILARLSETYVNRAAVEEGEKGSFTFFDLSSGEAKWKVPISGDRIRVSRERLRAVMLHGLEVEWEKRSVDVRQDEAGGVTAVFQDGTVASGCVLMGCDGANSQVRRLCHPDSFENEQLPVRFIGAGVRYSEPQVAEMRKLDPFFLQGSDPRTDAYLWFSFLNTPADHGFSPLPSNSNGDTSAKDNTFYCQVMTSWPYRPGFLNHPDPIEMPATTAERLAWMKTLAANWAEPFRSIVLDISEDSDDAEILPVHLADWLPRHSASTSFNGRVVLLGDAAHSMVMYRGEGANHAIVDVDVVLKMVGDLVRASQQPCEVGKDDAAWKQAVEAYEGEMIERTSLAVRASRQACLDAHDSPRLDENSPLVRRRLMRVDLEERESGKV